MQLLKFKKVVYLKIWLKEESFKNMISSIILGAGMSKRMGSQNKLLLKINNNTILRETIKNIIASNVTNCTVILGHDSNKILSEIDSLNINIVINKYYKEGLSSSIRAGVNNLKQNTKAVMICLGDMPLIKTSTYNQLLSSFEKVNEKKILVPFYKELKGNPIIFSHHYFSQLIKLKGDCGAKNIINQNRN